MVEYAAEHGERSHTMADRSRSIDLTACRGRGVEPLNGRVFFDRINGATSNRLPQTDACRLWSPNSATCRGCAFQDDSDAALEHICSWFDAERREGSARTSLCWALVVTSVCHSL